MLGSILVIWRLQKHPDLVRRGQSLTPLPPIYNMFCDFKTLAVCWKTLFHLIAMVTFQHSQPFFPISLSNAYLLSVYCWYINHIPSDSSIMHPHQSISNQDCKVLDCQISRVLGALGHSEPGCKERGNVISCPTYRRRLCQVFLQRVHARGGGVVIQGRERFTVAQQIRVTVWNWELVLYGALWSAPAVRLFRDKPNMSTYIIKPCSHKTVML